MGQILRGPFLKLSNKKSRFVNNETALVLSKITKMNGLFIANQLIIKTKQMINY